jgi:hypothetical protein
MLEWPKESQNFRPLLALRIPFRSLGLQRWWSAGILLLDRRWRSLFVIQIVNPSPQLEF